MLKRSVRNICTVVTLDSYIVTCPVSSVYTFVGHVPQYNDAEMQLCYWCEKGKVDIYVRGPSQSPRQRVQSQCADVSGPPELQQLCQGWLAGGSNSIAVRCRVEG